MAQIGFLGSQGTRSCFFPGTHECGNGFRMVDSAGIGCDSGEMGLSQHKTSLSLSLV